MQQSPLIKNRYRITRVLRAQQDYAALLAVDIEDEENRETLINVYEGEVRKHYADRFSTISGVPEFRQLTVDRGALCAFFEYHNGPNIDDVFYRGAAHDWQTRCYFAGELFHLALRLSQTVPEAGCAAFLSENLIVRLSEERILQNYCIAPVPYASHREMVFLLIDQVKKVLLPRWDSAPKELEFISVLSLSEFPSVAALYSFWLEYEKAIRAQYAAISKKSGFHRFFYFLFQNMLRSVRRKGR